MRNQSQDLKNKRLTFIVIILLIIIVILSGYLAISRFYNKNDTDHSSLTESSIEASTMDVANMNSDSSTEAKQSTDEYPYSIENVENTRFKGYFPNSSLEIRITLNENLTNAILVYGEFQPKPEGLKQIQFKEGFAIEQIPTKDITVREGLGTKIVHVNTYLKVIPNSESFYQPTDIFFLQFNDQKLYDVYLFYSTSGDLALAYQLDQKNYAQINFVPLSEGE